MLQISDGHTTLLNKPSAAPLLRLPQSVRIVHILCFSKLGALIDEILLRGDPVALDAEWYVDRSRRHQEPSLLQIASEDCVALVDLFSVVADQEVEESVAKAKVSNQIGRLFKSKDVGKFGWNFKGDLTVLRLAGYFTASAIVESYVEASDWFANDRCASVAGRGLEDIVIEVLGTRLDKKKWQKSRWDKRPLCEEMVMYAAIDAWVLLRLAEEASLTMNETPIWKVIRLVLKGTRRKVEKCRGKRMFSSEMEQVEKFKRDATKQVAFNEWTERKRKVFIKRFACKKNVYDNCVILSKTGQHLAFCDEKKALWYLRKNLASIESDSSGRPLRIRLTFVPKGREASGFTGGDPELTQSFKRHNRCVVCAASEHFTRYHIIPVAYRRHFPVQVKSHSPHDVVVICVDCHERANYFTAQLKKRIALEFQIPLCGEGYRGPNTHQKLVIKAAHTLSNTRILKFIPPKRMQDLRELMMEGLALDPLEEITQVHLDRCKILGKDNDCDFQSHGELVVKRLMEGVDTTTSLHSFIRRWRIHFVDCMKPQFLPEDFSVDTQTRVDSYNFFLGDAGFRAYQEERCKSETHD